MVTEDTTQIRLENHLTNLSTDLYSLYETSTLVDVTLACDGGNLFAHKVILSASSPFFAEIFASNPCKHPVIVLRSQNFAIMKAILEFMYRGYAAIQPKSLKSILKITKELEIKGFEKLEYMNSMNMIPNIDSTKEKPAAQSSTTISYSRDTRFKGTKRVNVNFEVGYAGCPKKANSSTSSISKDLSGSDVEPLLVVAKEVNYESDLNDNAKLDLESPASDLMKTTLVDLDCKICLKTFKNRNQLYKHMAVHRGKTFRCDFCHKWRVHTGERPYQCRRCGKAFARQDKLKLHIKASHDGGDNVVGTCAPTEDDFDEMCNEDGFCMGRNGDGGDMAHGGGDFQIGQVQDDFINLNDNLCASEDREHYTLKPRVNKMASPELIAEVFDVSEMGSRSKKRGRGRPRKYPPKSESLHCLGPKRGRGRPRKSISSETPKDQDNYDLNNLPYGDLNLLTMPLQQEMIEMPNAITNVNADDRSQDPLNVNITTNTSKHAIVGYKHSNSTYQIKNAHKNVTQKLASLKLLENLSSLTDITITAQPARAFTNDKTDSCDNDVDICQDDDNFSSSLDSLPMRSNDSDKYDIDVKDEPLSDSEGDLIIDENRDDVDIDSAINKISIVTVRGKVTDDGVQ